MLKNKTEPSARDCALRLLARREHSRFELAQKLQHAGCATEEISTLLDELESKNWLSDRRFAESYVADHRARAGAIKLAYALRQRGIADTLIAGVLEALSSSNSGDSELERARTVWQKKFDTQPSSPQERAKQMRFLQGRGFSMSTIRSVMADNDLDD